MISLPKRRMSADEFLAWTEEKRPEDVLHLEAVELRTDLARVYFDVTL